MDGDGRTYLPLPGAGDTAIPRGVGAASGDAGTPLRILQELRMYAQTGRRPDDAVLAAMRAGAPGIAGLLDGPAAPAAFDAIDALLVGGHAGEVIERAWDILAYALPILGPMAACPQHTPFHAYGVLGHTARVVDASPACSLSRWAALLHDCGKPASRRTDTGGRDHFKGHAGVGADIADGTLRRIGAPDSLRADICTLVRLHERYTPDSDAAVRATLRGLGGSVELYRALLALQIADSSAKAPGVTERRDAALRTRARLDAILTDAG